MGISIQEEGDKVEEALTSSDKHQKKVIKTNTKSNKMIKMESFANLTVLGKSACSFLTKHAVSTTKKPHGTAIETRNKNMLIRKTMIQQL